MKKINNSAGKITSKNAPILNLDMDAVTMVFLFADPALPQAGDGRATRSRLGPTA
ncbi:copper-binding protein [Prosthecomicrobium sp. N25]|uniref:copper-binding protein n=1 Tax=Prosthecomicrobium sp. N25 TaxID=3129254 RepID=UPI003FCD54CC